MVRCELNKRPHDSVFVPNRTQKNPKTHPFLVKQSRGAQLIEMGAPCGTARSISQNLMVTLNRGECL